MQTTVLIPAYKPDIILLELIEQLKMVGFSIVVVDDGSGKEYRTLFEQASEFAQVISYDRNKGKGGALKTGLSKITELYPDTTNVITADADGQHSVNDICRMSDVLESGADFVVSTRKLDRNIPFRSWIGNALSRFICALIGGEYLSDNQSGLRGFGVGNIEWMTHVSGEKYDYEMNSLLYAMNQRIVLTELPIEAIYLDGNKASHFSPLLDTFRIYRTVFRTARASVLAKLLNILMVVIVTIVMGWRFHYITLPTAAAICVVLQWAMNKFIVFRRIKYSGGPRLFIMAMIRNAIYFDICALFHIVFKEAAPMAVVYLLSMIAVIPIEYAILKLRHTIKR